MGAVFESIAGLLCLMAVGFAVRRTGLLSRAGTAELARLVTVVTFPALCFRGLAQMDAATFRSGLWIPLLGFGTHALAAVVGFGLAPLFTRSPASRPTFVFATAIGNWIFLPLPLATALHGPRGATLVLLHNAGAQVFLWTFGVALFRGGRLTPRDLLALARNPGLVATVAGLAVGLTVPDGALEGGLLTPAVRVIDGALALLGSLTIPLATLGIGAQLFGLKRTGHPIAPVVGVSFARLVAAPAAVLAALAGLSRLSPGVLDPVGWSTEALIAAMPVSVSASAFAETHGGDAELAARATLVTTLLSVATVPFLQALLS